MDNPEELKKNLLQTLKDQGMLSQLEMQLKQIFQEKLKGQYSTMIREQKHQSQGGNQITRLSQVLVQGYLEHHALYRTLETFATEGQEKSFMSDKDICDQIGLQENSSKPYLESLISKAIVQRETRKSECATQTVTLEMSTTLEDKFKLVDSQYREQLLELKYPNSEASQEKLEKQKKNFEERLQKDMKSQMERFKELEIRSIRQQEAEKCRSLIEKYQQDLDENYMRKLTQLRTREQSVKDHCKDVTKACEKRLYDERQHLLQESMILDQKRVNLEEEMKLKDEQLNLIKEKLQIRERDLDHFKAKLDKEQDQLNRRIKTEIDQAKITIHNELELDKITVQEQLNKFHTVKAEQIEQNRNLTFLEEENKQLKKEAEERMKQIERLIHDSDRANQLLEQQRRNIELMQKMIDKERQDAGSNKNVQNTEANELEQLRKRVQDSERLAREYSSMQNQLSEYQARIAELEQSSKQRPGRKAEKPHYANAAQVDSFHLTQGDNDAVSDVGLDDVNTGMVTSFYLDSLWNKH